MPHKTKRRTRRRQRGGVNFRNILTEENAHKFMPYLDDDHAESFNPYTYVEPRHTAGVPNALPRGSPEEDPFINIRIIPMPWMSNNTKTIQNMDGPLYYPLPLSRFSRVGQVRGYGYHRGVIESEDYGGYVDTDYPDDDFPFIIAELTDQRAGGTIWNYGYSVKVLLRIPRNMQEVTDTLHGDRSHHLDYLIEVVHGHDTTRHISRIARKEITNVDDIFDEPSPPNRNLRAEEALIRLQSRARGRKTRRKLRGDRLTHGTWAPPITENEKMRRWIDLSKQYDEDDPIRGYEQFSIYPERLIPGD